MDTLLIAVTAISLAMAIGMALIVAKLLREDRARSEARVAALTAMSAEPVARPPAAVPDARSVRVGVEPIADTAATARTSAARRAYPQPSRLADFEIRRAEPVVAGVADLFADRDQPSPWGRRLAAVAALATIVAAIGFAVVSSGGRGSTTPAPIAASPRAAADIAPLELVSLRHAQQAQSLTVTGLVQNPSTGAPLSRIVATAFVFGRDGTFLASSRAPLDFTTLAPGDESPFVVTVPVTGEVSRYRIGFRAEDGRVIAHVDKRVPDALAGLQ